MKALRYHGTRDIRHESMDDPQLQSDRDAIVKMRSCAICGSDLHIFHGHGFSTETGFCVGHEAVGEVVEVGRAVTRLKAGDKVMIPASVGCGACRSCLAGNVNCCESGQGSCYGISPALQGLQADAFRIPAADANAVKIPDGLTEEQALKAPIIAEPLGLFDCCGVSDGAAAAIVTTPEIARALGKHDLVTVKALQLSVSNGYESQYNGWDGSHFHTARIAAGKAYKEAGIERPREQISMMEVHDCFSVTELVTMEDLFISSEGRGWRDVLDGFYDADGALPCQIDGGLKCFGHPIGASGLRMLYEMYLQLQGRAGERQLRDPVLGMTHNLGGAPASNVCSVAIIGREGA